jgi:uncharacterized protein (TIGR03083 family)
VGQRVIDDDTLLGVIWRDGLALADAAERAGLEAAVASCPGWSVADLVWHTGEVHYFWRSIVEHGWEDPNQYVEPDHPSDGELVAWYRRGVDATVVLYRNADPLAAVWSWAPTGGNVRWVIRRMAHETAVHRWDAEDAGGAPLSIDADLAADGIDEFLAHFADTGPDGTPPLGGTVHLHCTDVEGEWLVTESEPGRNGRYEVVREHAKGDVALRGLASDLLLALWRRRPLAGLEIFGDTGVAERFIGRTDLA